MNTTKAIVVGGGPAGLSAAIQLTRAHIPTTLIEAGRLGGRIHNAHCIENLLGFPQINGEELARRITDHAVSWNFPIIHATVTEVEKTTDGFKVTGSPDLAYTCRYVILATGTRPETIPELHPWIGKRVFHSPADLPEKTNQHIVIIGSGDIAYDYALSLAQKNTICLIIRGTHPRALPLLIQRAGQHPNIQILTQYPVQGAHELNGHLYISSLDAPPIRCNYALIAIGCSPNLPKLKFFHHDIQTRKGLCLKIGDAAQGPYRQIAIAMGDGLKAAMKIIEHAHTHL